MGVAVGVVVLVGVGVGVSVMVCVGVGVGVAGMATAVQEPGLALFWHALVAPEECTHDPVGGHWPMLAWVPAQNLASSVALGCSWSHSSNIQLYVPSAAVQYIR